MSLTCLPRAEQRIQAAQGMLEAISSGVRLLYLSVCVCVCVCVCRGSTYDDLRVDQTQSLSQALHGRNTEYADLQEWLAPPTTTPTPQAETAESATSAGKTLRETLIPGVPSTTEFDQFLQQRSQQAESLPPARHRAQMQRKEDKPDELFAL